MSRRRLVLPNYSDEDGDDETPNHHHQQHHPEDEVTPLEEPAFNSHPVSPNPNPTEPVPISDEEFIDVPDNLSSPSFSPEYISNLPSPPPPVLPSRSGCPIGDLLLQMGLSVNREWLDSCLQGLQSSMQGLDVSAKAKLCFQQFLFSDMNYSGGGVLPPDVDSLHHVDLAGPFVLQVDEIVNMSCPLKGRYQDAPAGIKRCLKLSMTDGVQRIFGMEYRPIKDLQVLAPAGMKIVICNVHVRHGLLMLVPEALEVLGGMVDELEAARQRLVAEVNKPPRGKRSRTGVVHSLATRATQAAWPSNGVSVSGTTNDTTHVSGRTNSSASIIDSNGAGAVDALRRTNDSVSLHGQTNNSVNLHEQSDGSNVIQATNASAMQVEVPCQAHEQGSASVNANSERTRGEFSGPMNTSHPSITVFPNIEDMQIDASVGRPNAVLDRDGVFMVDEYEQPVIFYGHREILFTYMACLSAKWAAMKEKTSSVRGKLKCIMTSVKVFNFKQSSKYELVVYVDDGSLISEIQLDHNLVEEKIGHSPEDVNAGLSSSDPKTVADMKETMKRFQTYLTTFEGIMLLEMNRTSPIPVALSMNQGCAASDGWLLLKRLTSTALPQTPQRHTIEPIEISP